MADNIYDNQPCEWVTIATTATDAFPLDGKGASTTVYASSKFGVGYKNAILQTVVITASAAGETCSVHLGIGGSVYQFRSPGAGSYSFDIGGSAGVFLPAGFHIRIPASNGVSSMTAYYRPQ